MVVVTGPYSVSAQTSVQDSSENPQSGATAPSRQRKPRLSLPIHIVPFVEPGAAPADAGQLAIAGANAEYFGGPVISNVHVVQVLYGSGAYLSNVSSLAAPSVASFFTDVTQSPFFDMLNEYSTVGVTATDGTAGTNQTIGHGFFDGQFTITPSAANNGATITDGQIQAELLSQVASGNLPAPVMDAQGNIDTIYMIYFPPGKTIRLGNMSSCVVGGFCAYHSSTTGTFSSHRLYYGVLPDVQPPGACSVGCGAGSVFDIVTNVTSHELAEAVTDPDVGIATSLARPLAWFDPVNGEIGDICVGQRGSTTANGTTYTVQQVFSNFQDDCAAAPPIFTFFGPFPNPTIGAEFTSNVSLTEGASTFRGTYTGTVHFTSSDSKAVLPPDYAFNPADLGSHLFVFTLNTPGMQTITATDGSRPGVSGENQVNVVPQTAQLRLTAPQSTKSGVATTVVVTARDPNFNVLSTYNKTVHFASSDGAAMLPPDTPLVNGTGTFTVTFNSAQPQTLTVFEAGSTTNFSQVNVNVLTSGTTSTTTTFVAGANPSTFGQSVAYTATVSGNSAFLNSSVSFFSDGIAMGNVTVDSTGHAPPLSAVLTGGTHTVFAEFSGDGSHQMSSSTPLTVTVTPAPTTVTVTASPSPSAFGANVQFTASITSPAQNANPISTPVGQLAIFSEGGFPLSVGPAPLPGSFASFNTNSLSVGTHAITATYTGNSSYGPSTSVPFNQVVNPAPPDYSITPNNTSATILAGQSVSFQIMTKSLNFFAGEVRFTCGNLPPLTTCKLSTPDAVVDGAEPTFFTTVSIQSTGPHASLVLPGSRHNATNAALWGLGALGLGVVFLSCAGPRKRSRALAAALPLLALAVVLTSCGGGSSPPPPPTPTPTPTPPPATPAGTYSLSISAVGRATSGPNPATPSQQLSLAVTVQP